MSGTEVVMLKEGNYRGICQPPAILIYIDQMVRTLHSIWIADIH